MENVSIGMGTQLIPPLTYKVIQRYIARTLKVTLLKFELKLSFVAIIIIYAFHNIELRQTQVRDRKRTIQQFCF